MNKKGFDEVEWQQISLLLKQIKMIETQIEKIKEKILSYSHVFKEELELLVSIPGISIFIRMAIMADIGDIGNFENARKLCSYLGIVPKSKEKTIEYRKMQKLKVPDAIIRATAEVYGVKLITADNEILKKVKNDRIVNPLSKSRFTEGRSSKKPGSLYYLFSFIF